MTNINPNHLQSRVNFLVDNRESTQKLQTELVDILNKIEEVNAILSDLDAFKDLKIRNINALLNDMVDEGILTDEEALNVFSSVTIGEYEHFKYFEKTYAFDIKREYIGNTSTFVYTYDGGDFFQIVAKGNDYIPLNIEDEFKIIRFEQVGLIKAILHLPLSEDEREHLDNEIVRANNNGDTDLFDDTIMTVDELKSDAYDALEAVKQIEIMHRYISDYKTYKNELHVLKEYVIDDDTGAHEYLEKLEQSQEKERQERQQVDILDVTNDKITVQCKTCGKIETIVFNDSKQLAVSIAEIKRGVNPFDYYEDGAGNTITCYC